MSENIYGGITIPSSPFIFDRYYDNYAAATAAAASDGIMYGRYVLVAYSQTLFDYAKRCEIEADGFNSTIQEEQQYRINFEADNNISYDRVVLKKNIENGQSKYKQICCLHPLSGNEYSDDVMSMVVNFNALNIKNGTGSGSLEQSSGRATGINSVAWGTTQANSNQSVSMGIDTQSNYPADVVLGRKNMIPYHIIDEINDTWQLQPLLEIGVGNQFLTSSVTGLMFNNTNSIVHSRFLDGGPNKIKLIHGWRVKENTEIEKSINLIDNTKINAMFTPAGDISLLYETDGKLKYANCYLVGKYRTLVPEQCSLSISASNIIVTYPKELDDGIIGIYIDALKDIAPDILYGINNIMSGIITYHSLGDCGCACGNNTMAQGQFSLAEGELNRSYGHASHSEGLSNAAIGDFSHAEGESTAAVGTAAHSEGCETRAEGIGSLSAGFKTTAQGDYSVALGNNTIAKKPYSVAVGQYNTGNCTNAYFEVGIGTREERKTGFYVDNNGLAYLPEANEDKINNANDMVLITKNYANNLIQKQINDYIIEHGIIEGKLYYNANAKTQEETDKNYTVNGTKVNIYYEKWKSGKSYCRFSVSLAYNTATRGNGGGYYIACKIVLPSDCDLFGDYRFPALITPGESDPWGFYHCYDNLPAASGENKQVFCPVMWINDLFISAASQIYSHPSMYIEAQGFWKDRTKYGIEQKE